MRVQHQTRQPLFLSTAAFLLLCVAATATGDCQQDPLLFATVSLTSRLLPDHHEQFCFEAHDGPSDPNSSGQYAILSRSSPQPVDPEDVDSGSTAPPRHDLVVIQATDPVAAASGLHHYLKYVANCSVSWWGDQLNLPDDVPLPEKPIHGVTSYERRYYMNTCTFGYSTTFWSWERWEREIDWMALNGINQPLAYVGQEYVWSSVLTEEFGLLLEDLDGFFTGPSFLPWNRMGNLDAWSGPLPSSWMESQRNLQTQILNRMRQFRMKPILPGFAGFVPEAFVRHNPNVTIRRSSGWVDFPPTYQVSATDPTFAALTRALVSRMVSLWGTNHIYAVDLWNEMTPPSDNVDFLSEQSKAVFDAHRSADPEAVWVMQGWLFQNQPSFWGDNQIRALVQGVPTGGLVILDLYAENVPIWNRTESFFGTPFVWNMLHNFGGRSGLYGRLPVIASAVGHALSANFTSGALRGVGLTPEGIETNPIVYDLMMENVWNGIQGTPNLDHWVQRYAERRYGVAPQLNQPSPPALDFLHQAWSLLQTSVYSCPTLQQGTSASIIAARPDVNITHVSVAPTALYYDPQDVVSAWTLLLNASTVNPSLGLLPTFQADIVAVTTQAVSALCLDLYETSLTAYNNRDYSSFQGASQTFLKITNDLDELLGTQQRLLLGAKIAEARACAAPSPSPSTSTSTSTSTSFADTHDFASLLSPDRRLLRRGAAGAAGAAGGGGDNPQSRHLELLEGCIVSAKDRLDCGDSPSTSAELCHSKGCCFDMTAEPRCFFRVLPEADLYELNLRTQITLWGPETSSLHGYAYKLYSGLVADFYLERWRLWFASVGSALRDNRSVNVTSFEDNIRVFEELWTQSRVDYPASASGDPVHLSTLIFNEYFTS